MARLISSQPLYFLGDLESSYRQAKLAFETGKETGDFAAMAIAVFFWPPSAPGTIPATRDALKITKTYLSCRAHALREEALINVLQDQPDRARRFFDESLRVAKQQHAAYEYAKTLVARGEAGLRLDWDDADEQLAKGREQVTAMEDFEK